MSISEYNYEAYFLDSHEGRLDAAAQKELMEFIARHPELKEEFESFESVSLNDLAEEIKFENKESLKRSAANISASNFDDTAIQYVEGTLNAILTNELMAFVKQNPKYENELALYRKTKLVADTSLVFENKELLKKRSRQRPVVWYYWSAAAAVAILIAAYFFVNNNRNQPATIAISNTLRVDTSHFIQPVHSPNNKETQKNIAQNQIATVSAARRISKHLISNRTITIGTNSVATLAEHGNIESDIVVQNNVAPVKKDSEVTTASNNISLSPVKDTSIHTNSNQELAPQFVSHNNNETKSRSVFAFAANTFNGIKRFLKRGVEVDRYYSKESDKVIAYQITLGDNRFTLPVRNNSY